MDSNAEFSKASTFSNDPNPWKDREIATSFVSVNIPKNREIKGHPPDPNITVPSDLIISLKSCGHHYPVGVYIDLMKRSLLPNGRIILDIRRGTSGLKIMCNGGFTCIGTCDYDSPKCERMVFRR